MGPKCTTLCVPPLLSIGNSSLFSHRSCDHGNLSPKGDARDTPNQLAVTGDVQLLPGDPIGAKQTQELAVCTPQYSMGDTTSLQIALLSQIALIACPALRYIGPPCLLSDLTTILQQSC